MDHARKASIKLQNQFGGQILSVEEFRGQTTIVAEGEIIAEVCTFLRDDPELDFNLLAALTAVDYWPDEPRFSVVYQLYSMTYKAFLGVRVPLLSTAPEISTIEGVFSNANWHEREVYDMFGILFTGHSDLRRILMPFDWEGHPLRKDYPLGYEEVQFSFNFNEIDKRKPYAKE